MFKIVLTAFLLVTGVLCGSALAEDKAAPEEESLLTLINYGGGIGYFTIFLNFVGMGFVIEHFINIRKEVLMPPEVVQQIEQLFEEGEYEEAMAICESRPTHFTKVIGAALPKIGTGYENIKSAAQAAHEGEATKLFQKIGHINFIANIAPSLGLFGTVWGMMFAFSVIAHSATPPTPAELAGGIQQAIVTTVIGLAVNIPLSGFFYFFRYKVIRLADDVGGAAMELLDRFREQ